MVDEVYRNAFKEVYLILENTDEALIKNIPDNFMNFIKENMNEEYETNLNLDKPLDEQNILEETYGIIALIYRTYLATDEEKNIFSKQAIDNRKENENKKRKNYKGKNIEELFENKNKDKKEISENFENNQLIKNKENIFKKFLTKIKKLF